MEWKSEVSICKLSQIEEINNRVILDSTGYVQYPVINHNGKEYEKEYIYICESLCCIVETHYKSAIF